jgi:hypothetical protein
MVLGLFEQLKMKLLVFKVLRRDFWLYVCYMSSDVAVELGYPTKFSADLAF